MKILCEKNELLNGVNIALKAIPSKTTMEILDCIKIKAEDGFIELVGNDMSLGIKTKVKGEIVDEGSLVVNAKIFSDIIRKLPDSEVAFTASETTANIKCENVNFDIPVRSADDYPDLPDIEKKNFAIMSQMTLRDMIRQTVFSIAPDTENMKIMTGELLEINGKKLRLVSLDGHRISLRNVELNEEFGNQKVIIPGKTLNELLKILSGELEDKVTIYFSDNHILFEMENTIVLSRLIEGEYYLVDRMISGDYETLVHVNKREISESIDRATLLLKENEKKPLVFDMKDGEMEVKLKTPLGNFDEKLNINKEGDDIKIAFNPKFMLDALRVIDEENIDIYFMNVKSPCIIKDKTESYMYLILPVNFNAD
ncbi:MAG: DNA polymerase III subunit beta [Lachnospiraceae bacterium]|nr:DNA polymerase III subunit beta [Lachnospiraceae bacterium]